MLDDARASVAQSFQTMSMLAFWRLSHGWDGMGGLCVYSAGGNANTTSILYYIL